MTFANDRRLTKGEKETIARWVADGAVEGDPQDLPTPPNVSSGWQLGEPDLIVEMTEPFVLPPGGSDAFRNFVIPVPVQETRYIRAAELQPGDSKHVHHAILYVDMTRSARQLDERDPEPGFPGMHAGGAVSPDGHFLAWTPGNVPFGGDRGLSWRLEPAMDLVLQLHMLPGDTAMPIRPRIGFYFTDQSPTNSPIVLTLRRLDLDIPPGEANYAVQDRFEVPVDVRVLSVYPHAHYLGKDLHGYAVLPDGESRELIHVPRWDFMRQGQYYYAEPIFLPRGSMIVMDYTFDNTTNNSRNPHHPPERVTSGNRSIDEMAELILEVQPAKPNDLWTLIEARSRHDLALNPSDWRARFDLGVAAEEAGHSAEAIARYRESLQTGGELAPVHYNLGNLLLAQGETEEAVAHFEKAVALNPGMAEAYHNLGYVSHLEGKYDEAIRHYRKALQLKPNYARSYHGLGNAEFEKGDFDAAITSYEAALRLEPDYADAHVNLGNALHRKGRTVQAIESYRRALQLRPADVYARYNLAMALRALGRTDEAIGQLEDVLRVSPKVFEAHFQLGEIYREAGDTEGAARHYRQALALDPGSSQARQRLADLAGSPTSQRR